MNLLDQIRILDFTRMLPGPLATQIMAQMGADVIKIEHPERKDLTRFVGKKIDDAGIIFHQLNNGKKIRFIDYQSENGKTQIEELIKNSDILIEQFRPGAMKAWGLDYQSVQKINPEIIYVSVTGYGQHNSFSNIAGHDLNYLAYSGISTMIRDEQNQPVVPETQFADISGAYMLIVAIQSAIIKKFQNGKGAYIDFSLAQSMLPFLSIPFALHQSKMDYRNFNILNGKTAVNYAYYQCKDLKWISLAAMEIKFWNRFCEVAGKEDWKRKNALELLNINFPKEKVVELFKSKTQKDWLEQFSGQDVCIAPVLEIEELETDPYHLEQESFTEFRTASQTLKQFSLPFKMHIKED